MRCWARNRDFTRCKNKTSLIVCKKHIFQLIIFLCITIPGIIVSYSSLYELIFHKPDHLNSYTQKEIFYRDSLRNLIPAYDSIKEKEPIINSIIKDSKLKLVDLKFNEPEGNQKKIVIDIKLRNIGEKVAFIKKAKFYVKNIWELSPLSEPLGPYEISYIYDVFLPILTTPYNISTNLSQEIKSNEVDRFTISLGNDAFIKKYLYRDLIFLMSLELIYNENNKLIKSQDFVVSTGRSPQVKSQELYQNLASYYFVSNYSGSEHLVSMNKKKMEDLIKLKTIKNERVSDLINAYFLHSTHSNKSNERL